MANATGLIPTGDALRGITPILHIKRQEENAALGRQSYDFGALYPVPFKIGDREFPVIGFLGAPGKTVSVVAEFNPNPGMGSKGEHEKPAIKIYTENEGELQEVVIAFRKKSDGSDREFYTGNTTGTPRKNFVFWKHEPKAASDQA